jgi:hypothetical protein
MLVTMVFVPREVPPTGSPTIDTRVVYEEEEVPKPMLKVCHSDMPCAVPRSGVKNIAQNTRLR